MNLTDGTDAGQTTEESEFYRKAAELAKTALSLSDTHFDTLLIDIPGLKEPSGLMVAVDLLALDKFPSDLKKAIKVILKHAKK